MTALPPEHFPMLVALAPAMASGSPEDRFAFGVDLLVQGLKSLSADVPAPPGPPPTR